MKRPRPIEAFRDFSWKGRTLAILIPLAILEVGSKTGPAEHVVPSPVGVFGELVTTYDEVTEASELLGRHASDGATTTTSIPEDDTASGDDTNDGTTDASSAEAASTSSQAPTSTSPAPDSTEVATRFDIASLGDLAALPTESVRFTANDSTLSGIIAAACPMLSSDDIGLMSWGPDDQPATGDSYLEYLNEGIPGGELDSPVRGNSYTLPTC